MSGEQYMVSGVKSVGQLSRTFSLTDVDCVKSSMGSNIQNAVFLSDTFYDFSRIIDPEATYEEQKASPYRLHFKWLSQHLLSIVPGNKNRLTVFFTGTASHIGLLYLSIPDGHTQKK